MRDEPAPPRPHPASIAEIGTLVQGRSAGWSSIALAELAERLAELVEQLAEQLAELAWRHMVPKRLSAERRGPP
ncbi:hypothetical protein ACWDKQ_19755 [Saccharopolyspora sp. NPDC000995]